GIDRRPNVDLWRRPPQPSEDAPVEIGISLVFDSQVAPAAVSQSTPHSFASIARAATLRHAVLPPGTRRSPSGLPGRMQGRRGLVRGLRPNSFPPCSRPTTFLRETERRANRETPE